jgi:mono/diheme cytochrome c family protein
MIGAASMAACLLLSSLAPDSTRAAFDGSAIEPAVIVRGAQLAAVGNCGSCHTSTGGRPYAGGRALETPFGTIFSTNITPDAATGIGNWSKADFLRAMHEGVGIGGRQLYPAFPYDHFTKVTDDDVGAIYAFVMTRDPVVAETPSNELRFPANVRPLLSIWRALFFKAGVYQPDPSRSEEWNRGAYLVTGLGHCGACHTPHDGLGVEDRQRPLAGGDAESWHAPALSSASIAPLPWTTEQLVDYLRRGNDDTHGIAVGPMASVSHNLSQIPERDVRAIAHYIASTMAPADGSRRIAVEGTATADRERHGSIAEHPGIVTRRGGAPFAVGASIYADACATCHDAGAAPSVKTVPLAQTTSVNAPDPRNVIHIVLNGIWPQGGEAGALMPGFAGELTLQQTAAVIEYMRSRFSDRPAWNDVPEELRAIAGHRDHP